MNNKVKFLKKKLLTPMEKWEKEINAECKLGWKLLQIKDVGGYMYAILVNEH